MHKSNFIGSCFWLIFATAFGIYAYHAGLGSMRKPGPGFLFFWVAIALAVMSTIGLVQAALRGGFRQRLGFLAEGINFRKILMVIAAILVYVLLLTTLGFVTMTFLLFVYLLAVVEKRSWWKSMVTSGLVTVGAYLLFETWLQTRLPAGLLTFLRS